MTEDRAFKSEVDFITRKDGKVICDVYRAVLKSKKYEHPLFYTFSKKSAENKADWKESRTGGPTEVLPYTLTFEKPLEVPVYGTYKVIEYIAGELRISGFLEVLEELDNAESDVEREELILDGQKVLFDWAFDVGYDGIITKDEVIDLRNYDRSKLWTD